MLSLSYGHGRGNIESLLKSEKSTTAKPSSSGNSDYVGYKCW